MAARSLLDPLIDQKHRASHFEADPQSMEPLQTRTPKKNWMIHPQWEDRLKWAGLLPFARLVEARENVSRLNYDAALITCLVDRWRPETHTFHFRWGEMAPTLQDVSMLLGLPLAGEPIGPLEEPVGWMHTMDARFVGVREGVGPISFEAHGPRQAWLHEFQIEQFGYPDVAMTAAQITRSLEAYLMWLLGKTMFTDNHGNTISARYIPIAQGIAEATEAEHIIQRSWGSAVLAATYRGMCKGCQLTSHGSGIVGCPLLLQLWSWARFPIGRPEIRDGSWPPDELYDAERIDMPTFGSLWTSRKRHFGHNQLRNCYPAFTEQFDLLLESDVTWEPYSEEHLHEAYPGGISNMCTRDWAYWMTKAKIIFDIFVEEMSQQRVMRQLWTFLLPPRVHAYNRKGANKTAAGWLQLLAPYITGWANAPAVSWATMEAFDLQEFEHYLRAYMPRTRLRLSQPCDPVQRDPSTMWDTYPRHSTSGTRHHAAVLTAELQDDAAQYARSLSSGPLLGRYEHHASFAQRLQDKLRRIYATITCTRSSDVAEYRAAQRPPRPSLQVHQPRHAPRPRMEVPPSPRPPSPNQAGGSGWQNQQQQEPTYEYWQRAGFGMEQQFPMPNFGWRPRMDEPEGTLSILIVHHV
nr:serine/threonine-protein phosphatase 7 long form homolog [Lolium perenne]